MFRTFEDEGAGASCGSFTDVAVAERFEPFGFGESAATDLTDETRKTLSSSKGRLGYNLLDDEMGNVDARGNSGGNVGGPMRG